MPAPAVSTCGCDGTVNAGLDGSLGDLMLFLIAAVIVLLPSPISAPHMLSVLAKAFEAGQGFYLLALLQDQQVLPS